MKHKKILLIIYLLLMLVITACSTDKYTLELSQTGQGSIEPQPDEYIYEAGETITLNAEADQGWEFYAWEGSIESEQEEKELEIHSDLAIQAVFKDVLPPEWTTKPAIDIDREAGKIEFEAEVDKEAKLYYQLLDYNQEIPSSKELKTNADGVLESEAKSFHKVLEDLDTSKDYYLAMAIESEAGILKEKVAKQKIIFSQRDSEIKKYRLDYYDDKELDLGFLASNQEAIVAITPLYFQFGSPSSYDWEITIQHGDEQVESKDSISALTESTTQPSEQEKLDQKMRKKGADLLTEEIISTDESDYSILSESYQLGEKRSFYTSSSGDELEAELKKISEETLIYLETGHSLAKATLKELAAEFDNNIYPTVTDYFGREDTSFYDIDDNDKTIILIKDMSQRGSVRGYFNPRDLYDSDYSNQADMIYLNYQIFAEVEEGKAMDGILATAAHELQHLIFQVEKNNAERKIDDTWINEGFSGLAEYLTGYNDFNSDRRISEIYFPNPYDESLVQWSSQEPSYGSTRLFALYIYQRLGEDIIWEISSSSEDAISVISDYYPEGDFTDLYLAWLLSNYISNFAEDTFYTYPFELEHQPSLNNIETSSSFRTSINSSAAKYLKIVGQDKEVDLEIDLPMSERVGIAIYSRFK